MIVEIPLVGGSKNAHQSFVANLGGNEFNFFLDFMPYIDNPAWNLSIEINGNMVIEGLLLKCGCDLLKAYQFGLGALVMQGEEPTLNNLGISNKLLWASEDEKIRN